MNTDGGIAPVDATLWFTALAGPNVSAAPNGVPAERFECADLDADDDVDLADYARLQNAFGAGA